MKLTLKFLLLFISLILSEKCSRIQENTWTQFRGTNSLGIAPESATPPLELNSEKNLAWKIPLASGLSSPCIFEGRIFMTGFNPTDSALITYCIDSKTGSKLWEQSVSPDTLEVIHHIGSHAVATPTTDGNNVYVYFASYGVVCFDPEGKLLWEHRLAVINGLWGSGASPIVHDSLLIINRGDPTKEDILAIDCRTGKTVWDHILGIASSAPLPANFSSATPVIWRDKVVIHRAFELNAINLKDGNESWTIPIVTAGVSTPVIMNDILYVNGFFNSGDSRFRDEVPDFDVMTAKYDTNQDRLISFSEIPSEWLFYRRPELKLTAELDTLLSIRDFARYFGFDSNKDNVFGKEEWNKMKEFQSGFLFDNAVLAFKLDSARGSDRPGVLWKEKEYVSEIPSLLVLDDKVYMVTNGGILSCYEAKTGKLLFRERLKAPGGYFASPLYAGGNIYFASYNGRITVIRPGDKLNIVAQSDLHERIGASPVALGKMLFIRTETGLYAFNK